MYSERLTSGLANLLDAVSRIRMLTVADVGSTVRYLGLCSMALGVASSSLTFNWIIEHRVEQNFFPEFAGLVLYLSDFFLVAGLAVWTGGWNLSPRLNLRFGPKYVFIPLGGIVLLSLLSILWSVDGSQAGITAARRVILLALYIVIVTESPRALGPMAAALIAIGILHAGIAIAQVSFDSALGLSHIGELMKGAFGYEGIGRRGYGIGFNPNPVGMTIAVVCALSYGLFLLSRCSWSLRVLALALFLVTGLGLAATASRSSLLGWILGVSLVSLLAWVGAGVPRRTTFMRICAVVAAVLFLAVGSQFAANLGIAERLGIARLPSTGFKLMSDRFAAPASSTGLQGRFEDWQLSYPMIRDNLTKGVGAGSHPAALRQRLAPDSFGWRWTPVHNVPITATAELGVAGGLAWLLLMAAPFIWALRQIRKSKFEHHALLWTAPLLIVFVESLFEFTPFSTQDGRVLAVAVLGLWAGGVIQATDYRQTFDGIRRTWDYMSRFYNLGSSSRF